MLASIAQRRKCVNDTTYAVSVVAWLLAPQRACFACGSMEMTIFFIRFGGFAAKTNERNVHFRPAGGDSGLIAVAWLLAPQRACFACGSMEKTV
jgi:hypothetical protein